MKHKVINPFSPHHKAIIQYEYGAKVEGKHRAWVQYLSFHWDDDFPPSYVLGELREQVYEFAKKENLFICTEQAGSFRFLQVGANGQNTAPYYITEDNRITDENGQFISSAHRYRTF